MNKNQRKHRAIILATGLLLPLVATSCSTKEESRECKVGESRVPVKEQPGFAGEEETIFDDPSNVITYLLENKREMDWRLAKELYEQDSWFSSSTIENEDLTCLGVKSELYFNAKGEKLRSEASRLYSES